MEVASAKLALDEVATDAGGASLGAGDAETGGFSFSSTP